MLSEYNVSTVAEVGFIGFKNEKLLEAASEAKFDILLTIDKNIDSQQNIENYSIALVIFDVLFVILFICGFLLVFHLFFFLLCYFFFLLLLNYFFFFFFFFIYIIIIFLLL